MSIKSFLELCYNTEFHTSQFRLIMNRRCDSSFELYECMTDQLKSLNPVSSRGHQRTEDQPVGGLRWNGGGTSTERAQPRQRLPPAALQETTGPSERRTTQGLVTTSDN